MVFKKLYFPAYIAVLIVLTFLQSCNKKPKDSTPKKFDRVEINRLIDIGHKHYENEAFDSSYYYFNKAKYAAEIKKDTSRIIQSLSWMAEIQRNQGDYSGSETTSIEAFPFIENSNKYLYGETNIYIGLGNNYLITFDNENAIYYYKKAINSKTDAEIKSGIKNNIGLAYTEKGDYQKAIQLFLPLILKMEIKNNQETFARINDNLGHTYDKSGNSKSFFYLNTGLKIREKIKDNRGLISSHLNLSEYYKKRNSNLSKKHALLAYKKATIVKAVDERLQSLKLLIQNSSTDELKEHSLAFIHINDSINKVRQKAKNQFAKIKYDFKKEKDENVRLKAQKEIESEKQKKKNILLYAIVAIITVVSIMITNLILIKNRREKIKVSYNTEIRIAKKLHDELANDVYHTMAFAETQDLSDIHNKEILISNLDTIYSRTRNISRENDTMETGRFFMSNLKEMMSGFNTANVNVISNGIETINWKTLEQNKKIIVYRVLQEILVNMKKHSQASLVVLTFKKNKNKLQIDYTDNGIGATFEQLNSKNGLQNVENRIKSIKGTITFDSKSNKGFRIHIVFPI
ncbi:tetratricopeptide repeat protein [Flavobacterium limicola]|uniref:Tetratricopeptide repeat protein n=1 Tax=Flavobacterium limicola TaxID=180441 RepID=A0A495RSK6_9FLAO|nr:ATP-binding protein [Flavobacterium limicola]RKS90280.1 tetratricopeptide repeat protein [Flavobacterium limicola]